MGSVSEQLTLWEKLAPITVHCVFCPFVVHTGDGPDHAHDLMEHHYQWKHAAKIASIV